MQAATEFSIGEWLATPALNVVQRSGRSVRLEPRTMNLLVCLAERDGQVVSVDELIAAVWKGVLVSDGSVYLAISKLRHVLDDENTQHIETIPKRGYRLTVPVTRVEAGPKGSGPHIVSTGSRLAWPAAAVAATAAIVFMAWGLRETWPGAGSGARGRFPSELVVRAEPGADAPATASADVSRIFSQVYLSESLGDGLALVDQVTTRYPGTYQAFAHGARAFLYAQSLTNTHHASSVGEASRAQHERLVAEYARAALEANPYTPIAHIALGTRDLYNWRWSAARESFLRALQMTSQRTPAFAHAIWLSSWLGEHDRAIALAEETIRANADNPARMLRFLAFAHAYAGNRNEALKNVRVSLDGATPSDVTVQLLVSLEIATGDHEAALADLETLGQPVRGYFAALLESGRTNGEALEALRSRSAAGEPVGTGDWAMAHLAAGDAGTALSWLEQAAGNVANHQADASFHNLMFLKMNVAGDPVLEQQAFVDVLERIRGN